ncbi:ROK family protein [Pelagibius sp. Alg239-R121]|uniref:ROK family protein n=1 Tax=Pelagibius sp. Alg239-R121 TaxID=2993448 RepID=UPI0024A70CA1|nr:ROK family protein [Pelagibius sp. Alg239-R121]
MEFNRTEDLVAIADLVRDGRASTRGNIGELLSMRSTSVSELVGELVAKDLLRESTIKPQGRGRPAASLSYNHQRFGAVFISVVDRTLVAKAVDLAHRVVAESSVTPPCDAGNEAMADLMRRLVADITTKFPTGIEVCAIVCSLSGLLDVARSTWCFSSRWPELRNFDVAAALADANCAVSLIRNLDAELAGIRLHEGHPPSETALLLHWGYGIGAAYSADGEIVNRSRGRFCEIGHWSLGDAVGRHCTCGNTDCLETVAALWALGPELRQTFPGLPLDESGLAGQLRQLDLLESPAMSEALKQMLRLTTNLCRLLFPDRIILTGPFVQNPEIFSRFVMTLEQAPLLKSLDKVRVSVNETGMGFEIASALRDPFAAAVRDLASRKSDQNTGGILAS